MADLPLPTWAASWLTSWLSPVTACNRALCSSLAARSAAALSLALLAPVLVLQPQARVQDREGEKVEVGIKQRPDKRQKGCGAETGSGSSLRALVSQPTIVVKGPLNELRLENQDGILWQKLASSTKSIEGPIAWPIQPLSLNQTLTLRVRPKGASGGDFASYNLVAGSSDVIAETEAKIRKLGSDPQPWQGAIQSALNTKQQGLALALLFSDKTPKSNAIKQLQSTVIQRACL